MGKIINTVEKTCMVILEDSLKFMQRFCKTHRTCDGCQFREKHEGCMFRGKSPREW